MFYLKRFYKIMVVFLIAGLLVGLSGLTARPAQAQATADELSLSLFGYAEKTMYAPFDAIDYMFGLPADWILLEGASLKLDLAVFFDRIAPEGLLEGHALGGQLQVILNDKTVTTIPLQQNGDQTIIVPIPTEALTPVLSEGRHQLQLILHAEEYCYYGTNSTVIVRPSSRLTFPHQPGAQPTELSQLPRPIFQRNSYLPSSAILVIPDQPTADELQAAFAVSAGFGRMTGGGLQLSFLLASQLTPDLRGIDHLIFVGKPAGFPLWNEVSLPISVAEWANSYPEDGVVHLAVSPWNSSKVALFVSGSSDAAVIKAAQTVGSGLIMGNIQPDLALVQAVNPEMLTTFSAVDMTFADLGYVTETIQRVGVVRREFRFYVPPGMVAGTGASLKLSFTHSTLLDYDRSGLMVSLNDEPIGSARFDDNSAQLGMVEVAIPSSSLRAGMNRIMVGAELVPIDRCATLLMTNLWLTIRAESLIHLPLNPAPAGGAGRPLDLSFYPDLFSLSPTQKSVVFVISPVDLTAWRVASQLAFDLGDRTNWSLAEQEVAFADNIPQDILQGRDLLLIGRPSMLPLIAQLGDAMPAPFDAGSDVPRTQQLKVVYRIPPGASVGYLELLNAPWNADRAILAVLGNSDEGLLWSAAALITPGLRGKLTGDFAAIHGDQIVAGNVKYGPGSGSMIATAVPGGEIIPQQPGGVTVPNPRPGWVLPMLATAVLAIFIVLVFVLFSTWRQNRRRVSSG